MFDRLKNKGRGKAPARTEQETMLREKPENTAEAAAGAAFESFPAYLKTEYQEAESMVGRSEYGLELDYLYIGSDGHAEFASYDCDMTPPSTFEESFDLTFDPEEAEKLFRALEIGEDVIARGGVERFVCVFRALMGFVVPQRDSLQLSDAFPALLKKAGIRTADDTERRRLWRGSPFNYERIDADRGSPLWRLVERLPAEVGFSDPNEIRAYYANENRRYSLDIRQSERRGVYVLEPETLEWVYDPGETSIVHWDKPLWPPCFALPRELPGDTRLDAFLRYAEMLFRPENAREWDTDGQIAGERRTMESIMPAFLKAGYELTIELLKGEARYLLAPDLSEMGKYAEQMSLQSCLQYLLFACRGAAKSGGFRNAWEDGTLLAVVRRAASLHRTQPAIRSEESRRKKDRYEGCLLGGAAGDALGYPIEFLKEAEIGSRYGETGIRELREAGSPAVISDDTQMTLFAANAILYHKTTGAYPEKCLQRAYLEWLDTQNGKQTSEPRMWISEIPQLQVRRAPGHTCIAACRRMAAKPRIMEAENDSKGNGTVMRAAPFGLMRRLDEPGSGDDAMAAVRGLAEFDAVMTHGHPEAHESSAFLAGLIFNLVQRGARYDTLQDAIRDTLTERDAQIETAVALAEDRYVSDIDGIHQLGEGWTAGEALAIAVFCAVRYQDDFGAALRAAVNHGGDSDSTGAICGNLLGARLGAQAVRNAFPMAELELADTIREIADDLFLAAEDGVPVRGADPAWDQRYRR